MPTSVIFNHFPEDLLDILIGGFYSSIHLGALSSWLLMNNLKLLTYLSHQMTAEICTVINNDGFCHSKSAYQIVADKIGYHFLGYRLVRGCLHPLGEIINGNQNESVSIRSGWIYWTDDIHSPSYRWPRWTHSIKFVRWHSDQITVPLTFVAFLHKLATIILHSHPEVTGSKDLSCQSEPIHMCATNSCMYPFNKFRSFKSINTYENTQI